MRSLLVLIAVLGLLTLLPAPGRAQDQPNQAALVIQHGDGRVVAACVSFAEAEISGLELLDRAGVSYLAQSGGGGSAVCKLDGEGCDFPTEDCFCKCKGAECVYWAYQRLNGGAWSYSQVGVASTRVKPGAVEGWAWGSGSVQNGARPPTLAFEQVCAPATQPQLPTGAIGATEPPPAPSPAPATARPRATRTLAPPTSAPTEQPLVAPTAEARATLPATAPPATARPAPQPTTALAQVATSGPTVSGALAATFVSAGAATPTRGPGASAGGSGLNYLAFGGIVVLLLAGIVVALRRRG